MKISYIYKIDGENVLKYLALFLMIFQSLGLRIFEGQGILILSLISLIYFYLIKKVRLKYLFFILLVFAVILFHEYVVGNILLFKIVYLLLISLVVFLFYLYYKERVVILKDDFYIVINFFIIHSIIGYFLALIVPDLFIKTTEMNKSFLYLFYISDSNFMFLPRNTGLFWEPGVYQLIANLYLFLNIQKNSPLKFLVLATFSVLISFSSIGLFLLGVNFLYYMYKKTFKSKINTKNTIKLFSVVLGFSILIFPIIKLNILEKTSGLNTSGLVRLRDLYFGVSLVKEKPLLGHGIQGLLDYSYIYSKPYLNEIEISIFTNEYISKTGKLSGGFTNGFLGIFVFFGIPFSFYFIKRMFENKFVFEYEKTDKFIFMIIILSTLMTEPIVLTPLIMSLFASSFLKS